MPPSRCAWIAAHFPPECNIATLSGFRYRRWPRNDRGCISRSNMPSRVAVVHFDPVMVGGLRQMALTPQRPSSGRPPCTSPVSLTRLPLLAGLPTSSTSRGVDKNASHHTGGRLAVAHSDCHGRGSCRSSAMCHVPDGVSFPALTTSPCRCGLTTLQPAQRGARRYKHDCRHHSCDSRLYAIRHLQR